MGHIDLVGPLTESDHVLGPADSRVIVVEYGDFECPRCKQAVPAVEILLRRFPNDVRFIYRHFPLEDAHPHALQAAQAAECAGVQGKFWEMHALLFENQSQLEARHLCSYAEQLGLDVGRFTKELQEERYVQRVRADLASGQRSGVRGSPGFFVNGRIQDVSFGLHQLVDVTEAIVHPRT
jgi:protein-disulfide isomerase